MNLIVKLEDASGQVITKMDFNEYCKEATASDLSCGYAAPSMERLKESFKTLLAEETGDLLEGRLPCPRCGEKSDCLVGRKDGKLTKGKYKEICEECAVAVQDDSFYERIGA